MSHAAAVEDKVRTKGLAPLPAIAKIIKDDFSTHADHVVLKPKKKAASRGNWISKAICATRTVGTEKLLPTVR